MASAARRNAARRSLGGGAGEAAAADGAAAAAFPATHHGIASAPDFTAEVLAVTAAANAWARATNAHDAAAVAALYDQEALLYATFATIVNTPEGIAAYFAHLFQKQGLAVAFDDMSVRLYADNTATASGLYTFTHEPAPGRATQPRVAIPSRFSFVFVKEAAGTPSAGEWRIVEHHSSVDPEAAAIEPEA